ncbi:neuropilin-1a-like [Boleophthalmus pectinirostris]|uniref:neuropilin-1a-like n=1 Tax=Boleophthalmus pectinirostris TaxID=150288 RepID=UPI00242AE441|nr:neuropilin-1a-like [Boleophthalmus pectinirostris]
MSFFRYDFVEVYNLYFMYSVYLCTCVYLYFMFVSFFRYDFVEVYIVYLYDFVEVYIVYLYSVYLCVYFMFVSFFRYDFVEVYIVYLYDFVEVYNGGDEGAQMIGKFCGKIAPSPIVSSGSQLTVKFVSDYETHGAGFSIRYEVFKTGPECSRNFTAPQGRLVTPGFPDKYPNNLECTLMVTAPQTSDIVVEFETFDMEPDTTSPPGALCRFDWLEIWDGFPAVGPHIGRFCGQKSPGRIVSHTGILSMTITTDNAISREGFSANYTIRERSSPPGHHASGETLRH